ncbi:MAG: SDR family NAD(P)-dependent oxidoreductase [Acidobacteria bacterium]|nr:SDR family NAD(P)-dependent oxidoreductase [Acidobacteriota bacterium]
MRDLNGTVVAITGASSGIGAATARALGVEGASVVLGARRKDRLTEFADELGSRVAIVEMDVRASEDSLRTHRTGSAPDRSLFVSRVLFFWARLVGPGGPAGCSVGGGLGVAELKSRCSGCEAGHASDRDVPECPPGPNWWWLVAGR